MIKVKNSIKWFTLCCKVNLLIFSAFFSSGFKATNDPVVMTKFYVSWYAESAVDQMIEHKIPASVILAQAIFESRCGMSELALKSNNHFGIKCHIEWRGDTVVKSDDTLNECFRKYRSVEDSYTDHSLFLKSRSRYAHLFNLPVTDYKAWCYGLKNAGYATFPKYAEELIRIIEENKLYIFDVTETIDAGIILNSEYTIRKSKYSPDFFTLKEMARSEALFVNETDILIQSLDLVIERSPVSEEDIAEK